MICMAMFAAAFQYPASLCRDEEEGFAGTPGVVAPTSEGDGAFIMSAEGLLPKS